MEKRAIDTIAVGPLEKNKNKNKKPKWRFLTSRGAHVNCAIMAVIHSCYRKSAVEHDGGV